MEGERNAVSGRFGTRRSENLVELRQYNGTRLIGTHALPIWSVVFGDSYKCGLATTRIPGWFWKLNYCGVRVLVFFVVYTW